jgi:hypothetical protein
MRTLTLAFTASTALLVTLATTRPAHALGPVDIEIAAKVGYGTNDVGPGFGGRAGVSIFGFYGGVSAIDYLGQSVDGVTAHSFLFGGEVGYGIKLWALTIRPLVGFGDAIVSADIPVASALDPGATGTVSTSASSFYIEPGGLLQLNFGLLIFGVDAGCLILTRGGASEAFTIHGQIGLKF